MINIQAYSARLRKIEESKEYAIQKSNFIFRHNSPELRIRPNTNYSSSTVKNQRNKALHTREINYSMSSTSKSKGYIKNSNSISKSIIRVTNYSSASKLTSTNINQTELSNYYASVNIKPKGKHNRIRPVSSYVQTHGKGGYKHTKTLKVSLT